MGASAKFRICTTDHTNKISMASDPFYELKVDIEETVQDLQSKMLRFHGLQSGNVERKTLSSQIDAGCQSISWQVSQSLSFHSMHLNLSWLYDACS
jgi:hypothetical protein